ncbi:hypothetical protein L249_5716 [Ophiocordyceps polyrhachis-furcata BCC 54312]|uniref:Benzoylformate decarboxylase n=1 Tax=Ophiocordyceps polyrhachis-furcata BCC 54312 TaxID=1330021 RepID=A0A367KZV8_9HYPO|nr:hypothetical protein L249_5716 [Ophiocordyceps polyrhachis-furcata BCC 54312]
MHASTLRATTTIRVPPSVDNYVSLAQYQAQTPESFAVGRAVLHFHLEGATASIPEEQRGKLALFPADMNPDSHGQTLERKVDVFVNSEDFTVFSPEAHVGFSIPYYSISIHAIKHVNGQNAIWMQLELDDGGAHDDDFSTVELTLFPGERETVKQLFDAVSACSNLHPDPEDDSDEENGYTIEDYDGANDVAVFTGLDADGNMPASVPGSGGWITAENAHNFFDDEGNWIGENDDDDLGEGAGRVRPHSEVNGDGLNGADDDNKRPRVDEN